MSNQKSTKGKSKSKSSSPKPSNARTQNKQKSKKNGSQRIVSVSSAYSSQQMGRSPTIRQSKDSVQISHREFIGNVTSGASSAFTNSFVLELNPGIIATFPWLSTIAQNYETYMFRKVKLCYYTRTGSTTAGSVVMAPDYDAADSSPPTEQIMSTYSDVVEDAPWKNIDCSLRPGAMHPDGKRKFIRTEALANNLDIKTYDAANLYVFTVDSTAAAAWGKVWIEYDVVLHTPQSLTSLPVGLAGGRFSGQAGMTGALPLGSTAGTFQGTNGISYDGTTGAITFQKPGWYLLAFNFAGTGLAAPTLTLVNCTSQQTNSVSNTAATLVITFIAISVDAANGTMTPTLPAVTVTGCYCLCGVAPTGSLA